MTCSPALDFIKHLRRSATEVGVAISIGDTAITIGNCGTAELSIMLADAKQAGFSIVTSRRTDSGAVLGVMHDATQRPDFFPIQLSRASIQFPSTRGVLIGFLGPDGVGKGIMVDQVLSRLQPVFGEQRLYHWGPQTPKLCVGKEKLTSSRAQISVSRHGNPPHGRLASVAHLAGIYADYLVSQRRLIRPALRRGEMLLFDRYYHDILADSRHYRYGGPPWLLHAFRRLLPQRNGFFVVFDADQPTGLHNEPEASGEQRRWKQRQYADLARSLHALHVPMDHEPDPTLTEILRGIGRHLSHRFDEQLHALSHLPPLADPCS